MNGQQHNQNTPRISWLIKRMIVHRPWLRLVRFVLMVIKQSAPLIVMLFQKAFFDALQYPTERSILPGLTLEWIVVIYVLQDWLGIGLVWLRNFTGGVLGFWVSSLLQHNLLESILTRPGATNHSSNTGEVISTLRDDVETVEGIGGLPLDLFTQLVFLGGGMVILLRVDVQVTLLVLVPTLVVTMLTQIGRHRLEGIRKKSREAEATYKGGLGEALSLMQAIQVAGAESAMTRHLSQLGEIRMRATMRDWMLQESWWALYRFMDALGQGLVLLTAAGKLRNGDITVGDMAMYAVYLSTVGEYLTSGASTVIWLRLVKVSMERLLALLKTGGSAVDTEQLVAYHPLWLKESSHKVTTPTRTTPDHLDRLDVRGLSVRFDASDSGLHDVSFSLNRGTLTVLVGRIGSGKTTLLRALLGMLPLHAGTVYWNGKRVDDLTQHCIPPRVGYTPQVPVLLSASLRENVLLGLPDEPVILERAVHRAVLERDLAALPDGLDTLIGVRGTKLSGGQAQRVAAARMYVREPELLVMDDISSALDVETELVLWQRMFAQQVQNTCLVVSHRRMVLERADQILVMARGRIAGKGTLDELLESSEEMRRLVNG